MSPIPNPYVPPPFDPVPFLTPNYHYSHPFGQSAYQNFDPVTGDFKVIPNQNGYYLLGFKVREFRNGQLLSTVYRDFMVNVVDCTPKVTAQLAADTHDELTNTYTINLCTDTTNLSNESTYAEFIQEHQWQFDFPVSNMVDTAWSPFLTFPDAGVFTGESVLNPDSLYTDTATVIFNVTTEMQPDFQVDYDTCVGGPVSFFNQSSTNGGSIQQYDWSLGDGDSSGLVNPIHEYAAPGEYEVQLRIENEYGCWDSLRRSFWWQPAPPVVVVAPSEQDGCSPLAVYFENLSTPVDSTYQVVWEMGGGGILEGVSPDYSYANTGIYSVYVAITSPIGCFIDTVFTDLITVVSPPQADFNWMPEVVSNLQKEVFFQNESTGNLQNFWTINQQTDIFGEHPNYKFTEPGIYNIQLLIKNEYGCVDSLSKQLTVLKDYTYYLPNAFTPNEDGNNEVLKGKGIFAGISQFEMSVWNRYGEQVFFTKNIEEGWNGRRFNNGTMLTQGVYICQVKFQNEQGGQVKFQEKVTLLR